MRNSPRAAFFAVAVACIGQAVSAGAGQAPSPQAPAPVPAAASAEAKEPPVSYSVTIGGKSFPIVEDQPLRIDGTFTNPEIVLRAGPHRIFQQEGVTFSYPRGFGFESKTMNALTRSWIFSGNDFKIMYFVIAAPITVQDFVTSFASQFGEQNVKVVDPRASLVLGETTLAGMRLRASVGSISMSIDAYRFPLAAGVSRLLVLEDSLGPTGDGTPEGLAALELLKKTFQMR